MYIFVEANINKIKIDYKDIIETLIIFANKQIKLL